METKETVRVGVAGDEGEWDLGLRIGSPLLRQRSVPILSPYFTSGSERVGRPLSEGPVVVRRDDTEARFEEDGEERRTHASRAVRGSSLRNDLLSQ